MTAQPHPDLDPGAQDAGAGVPPMRRGRPRSDRAHRAILDATHELLVENGFSRLRLEHVATRAGVGKTTIYRRWRTREALVLELLMELAAPHIEIDDVDDTHAELLAATTHAIHALTETPFGPVIRALLSQIAGNPALGDPFRAAVVQGRRDAIARVIARGVARGLLPAHVRRGADPRVRGAHRRYRESRLLVLSCRRRQPTRDSNVGRSHGEGPPGRHASALSRLRARCRPRQP
jgi:AcrR family transcriptional regulator